MLAWVTVLVLAVLASILPAQASSCNLTYSQNTLYEIQVTNPGPSGPTYFFGGNSSVVATLLNTNSDVNVANVQLVLDLVVFTRGCAGCAPGAVMYSKHLPLNGSLPVTDVARDLYANTWVQSLYDDIASTIPAGTSAWAYNKMARSVSQYAGRAVGNAANYAAYAATN